MFDRSAKWLALVSGASLGLAVAASCGTDPTTPQACGPKTCATGCCDDNDVCQPGNTLSACGARGGLCLACGALTTCTSGLCVNPDAGTPDAGPTDSGQPPVDAGPQDIVLNIDMDRNRASTPAPDGGIFMTADGGADVYLSLRNLVQQALEEETDGGVIYVNGSRIRTITLNIREFTCINAGGTADLALTQANVRDQIVTNPQTIAFFGSNCGSGPSQVTLPITNSAGLVQMSFSAYTGLTKPTNIATEPAVYYPTGVRNFARIQVPEIYLATALMRFISEQSADAGTTAKLYIIHKSEQPDQAITEAARARVADAGLALATPINPGVATSNGIVIVPAGLSNAQASVVADDIANAGANWLFIATGAGGQVEAERLVRQVRAYAPTDGGTLDPLKIVVSTNIYFKANFLANLTAANTANLYAVTSGIAPSAYTGKALTWWNAYKAKYPTNVVHPFLLNTYDGTRALIRAIKRAGDQADNRSVVRQEMMGTTNFDGVLGVWSFDADGDINKGAFSSYAANGTTSWSYINSYIF